MIFSSVFSSAFATAGAAAAGYICQMMAMRQITAGSSVVVSGSGLLIGGKRLIGHAGKVFDFASPMTAQKWADNAALVGAREAALIVSLDAGVLAGWAAKKRAKLEIIAARLVIAAEKNADAEKRVALLAESSYCLSKWA